MSRRDVCVLREASVSRTGGVLRAVGVRHETCVRCADYSVWREFHMRRVWHETCVRCAI